MIDINSLKDPVGLINNLYGKLYNIKNELKRRLEEADCYYPTQDDAMNRRELDAIDSLIRFIENYDSKYCEQVSNDS